MNKFFYSQANEEDIISINHLVSAWKSHAESSIILVLSNVDEKQFLYYDSVSNRDTDFVRLQDALTPIFINNNNSEVVDKV